MTTRTLSEAGSKTVLAPYGVMFADEVSATDAAAAVNAAVSLGFPVVVKLNGDGIAHKTERGLVRLGLRDRDAVQAAADALLAAARPEDGSVSLLVAPHIAGSRELIMGVMRDPQFGAAVMLGMGGVLAELIGDVVFRLAPLTEIDVDEMIEDLATNGLLGPFRGEPPVDRTALTRVLLGLSRLATERDDVVAVDLNPLIVCDGQLIAVDALVQVRSGLGAP